MARIRRYKYLRIHIYIRILDNISSTNPVTRKLCRKGLRFYCLLARNFGWSEITQDAAQTYWASIVESKFTFFHFLLKSVDTLSSCTDFKPSHSARRNRFLAFSNRILFNKTLFFSFAYFNSLAICQLHFGVIQQQQKTLIVTSRW